MRMYGLVQVKGNMEKLKTLRFDYWSWTNIMQQKKLQSWSNIMG